MIAGDARLSIVILTEDTGKDGRPTVETLARRMLNIVVPGFRRDRVAFLPSEPREEEAMRGSIWKTDGRNPVEYARRVRLLRYVARRLLQDDTFVLFHVDGDTSRRTAIRRRTARSSTSSSRSPCRRSSTGAARTGPGAGRSRARGRRRYASRTSS